MSDTPETDNERTLKLALEVFTELANTLKQERDEARRKLKDLDVAAIHSCHNECQRPMCVLRRERDEARELAQQMSESNQVLMADVRFYRNAWEQLLKEGAK
jgi:hypothetical protein